MSALAQSRISVMREAEIPHIPLVYVSLLYSMWFSAELSASCCRVHLDLERNIPRNHLTAILDKHKSYIKGTLEKYYA
jgi:hypothetical protein